MFLWIDILRAIISIDSWINVRNKLSGLLWINFDFLDDDLITAVITPDKDIIPNAETLSPAYIVFDNYEVILKWNRSLRFALAVCTLKNKFENDI